MIIQATSECDHQKNLSHKSMENDEMFGSTREICPEGPTWTDAILQSRCVWSVALSASVGVDAATSWHTPSLLTSIAVAIRCSSTPLDFHYKRTCLKYRFIFDFNSHFVVFHKLILSWPRARSLASVPRLLNVFRHPDLPHFYSVS